jgi:hypothetical protein
MNARAIALEPLSLTVEMKYNEEPLAGLGVAVCPVANVREVDGATVFEAVPAFSGAEADFTDLTDEKNIALAASLNDYAFALNIERDIKSTDISRKAVFSGLTPGLYLIAQAEAENSGFIIAPYLVSVVDSDVIAYPKAESVKHNTDVAPLSVYKVWVGADSLPVSILVQLYRNGAPYGNSVTLNAGNHWSNTWDNLSLKDTWTVDELNAPAGYTKSISGSASGGFVITNTRISNAPTKILISGKKTWRHGGNPANKRPNSIVLQLKANGVLILQKEIGEAEQWSWSIWMDKDDKNGKAIVYTVDEAPVDGYIKTVDGYSLLNIYQDNGDDDTTKPDKRFRWLNTDGSDSSIDEAPDDDGTETVDDYDLFSIHKDGGAVNTGNPAKHPSLPITSDSNNLLLGLSIMGVSFASFATVVIFLTRRRRHRE